MFEIIFINNDLNYKNSNNAVSLAKKELEIVAYHVTPYFLFWGICVPLPEKTFLADFSPIRKQIRLNIAK